VSHLTVPGIAKDRRPSLRGPPRRTVPVRPHWQPPELPVDRSFQRRG